MRRVLVLLLAALPLTAAPPAAGVQPPRIAEPPAGIVRLLDDHARAWATRDRALLDATMRPGEFASSRVTAFDNASELPFDLYRLRVSTQYSGDLANVRVKRLYPGHDVAAFHVVEQTRIGGFDLEPYTDDGFFTFARESADPADPYDGWRLASDSDFEVLGAFSPHHLWDGGPVRSVQSEHFLLLAHPDKIDSVRSLLPVAERAYAEVAAWWPRPSGERYVVIAPSTTAELGEMIQATIDLTKFVAFAAATITTERGFEPAGVRIVLHLTNFTRYDAEGQQPILAHELIHAVTRPMAGPFIPTWVEEGLAMFGTEPESRAVARRAPRERFPTDDEFYVGSVSDIVTRYRQGHVAVAALDERYRMDGVARFYESLGKARMAPGTDSYHVRRALSEALDWSVDEWTEAWRNRIG